MTEKLVAMLAPIFSSDRILLELKSSMLFSLPLIKARWGCSELRQPAFATKKSEEIERYIALKVISK